MTIDLVDRISNVYSHTDVHEKPIILSQEVHPCL